MLGPLYLNVPDCAKRFLRAVRYWLADEALSTGVTQLENEMELSKKELEKR
jgi:hypothetical protein